MNRGIASTMLMMLLSAGYQNTRERVIEEDIKPLIDKFNATVPVEKQHYWFNRFKKTKTYDKKIALLQDCIRYWERRPEEK
jgi:hypothetical protein